MLMALAKDEWSKVTGFQRVRSTIRIFAATVYAQQERGKAGEWVPTLIGPGDLPLVRFRSARGDSSVAASSRTNAPSPTTAASPRSRSSTTTDTSGTARRQDLNRESLLWSDANPRAAERAATFIFLASIVGTLRPGRGRGASAPEVKAATSVPDLTYTITDADAVIDELVDPDRGLSALDIVPGQGNNKPARYFLSTRLTHRMLVNNIRRTITEAERDAVLAEFAQRLASTGPFREQPVRRGRPRAHRHRGPRPRRPRHRPHHPPGRARPRPVQPAQRHRGRHPGSAERRRRAWAKGPSSCPSSGPAAPCSPW